MIPALALAALLPAALPLVGCGAGVGGAGGGGVTGEPFYVASFRPGEHSPEEQKYVLTSRAGTPTAPTQTSGITPSSAAPGVPAPAIAWVDDGRYLAVITYGSSSCPEGPQSIRVVADREVEIRLGAFFPGGRLARPTWGRTSRW